MTDFPSPDAGSIDAAIGRAPMVQLRRVIDPGSAAAWVKLEGIGPGAARSRRRMLSGGIGWTAAQVAREPGAGARIAMIAPDSAARYLSTSRVGS